MQLNKIIWVAGSRVIESPSVEFDSSISAGLGVSRDYAFRCFNPLWQVTGVASLMFVVSFEGLVTAVRAADEQPVQRMNSPYFSRRDTWLTSM